MLTYSGKYDVLFPLDGVSDFASCLESLDDDRSVDGLDTNDMELVTALCLCRGGCDLFDCREESMKEDSTTDFNSIIFTEDCDEAGFELLLKL